MLFLKKKSILLLAVFGVSLLLILLYYNGIIGEPPQMPEIVFVCTKTNMMQQQEVCEITFIDKQGNCYYSDNPDVCESLAGKENEISAYRARKIREKLEWYGSCGRNEVIKKYRTMHGIMKRRDIVLLLDLGYTIEPQFRWTWKWFYFDESGEIRSVVLHEEYEGEDETNCRQVNQIYEWCNGFMKGGE